MKDVQKKILSFLHLPHGWNFGRGGPIDRNIVAMALAISERIERDVNYIEVFPLVSGQISIRVGLDWQNVIGLMLKSEKCIYAYIDNGSSIHNLGETNLEDVHFFVLSHKKRLK